MISNVKVLLLNVNREGWHSGNMIYDMECVKKACDTRIYGPGWPNYENNDLESIIKQLYGDDKPDIIYSYFTEGEKVGDIYINHYKIPNHLHKFPIGIKKVKNVVKIFALSDFWARKPQKFSKDLGGLEFSRLISCFTPPFSKERHFYSFFDENIRNNMVFYSHPRCVDYNCFKDYKLKRDHDVTILGSMSNFYPFRKFMRDELSKKAKGLGINFKNYGYCGSNFNHNGFVREEYAKAINRSKILVSCGGRYHLAFNKIFEAMGCGTLYLGERPYGEKELGLKDGFNYVSTNKENFLEKVKHYVENDKEREEIVKNAKTTFAERHTIDVRAKDFANLIEGILGE